MWYRYEEQMKEKNVLQKEDLSDMVAEHAAKQKVCACTCVCVCANIVM